MVTCVDYLRFLLSKHFSTSRSSPLTLCVTSYLFVICPPTPNLHTSTKCFPTYSQVIWIWYVLPVSENRAQWGADNRAFRLTDAVHTILICTTVWDYAIVNFTNKDIVSHIFPFVDLPQLRVVSRLLLIDIYSHFFFGWLQIVRSHWLLQWPPLSH